MVPKEILIQILRVKAEKHDLDPKLVLAIAEVESGFDYAAMRYEEYVGHYLPDRFAKNLHITVDTEKKLQQFSYGLMQLLGGTARWIGFTGPLPMLLDPELGADWGCRFISEKLLPRYIEKTDIISSYNAGSASRNKQGDYYNQSYVDKVLAAMARQ